MPFSGKTGLAALLVAASLAAAPAFAQPAGSAMFKGFDTTSSDPVQVDAASLEITDEGNQRISTFEGNVKITRGDTTMRADKMVIYSDQQSSPDAAGATSAAPAGAGGQPFNKIEATGNVRVESGAQVVTGKNAVFDVANHTITMAGGVVLTQGPNTISGARLTIDTSTGKARIEQAPGQQIRGVFVPSSIKPAGK
jgi:lipopolysaccharide export system protein LptA